MEQAIDVVADAIVEKLGTSLASLRETDSIDRHHQLQTYGVDSLLAIELRNWIVRKFKADVAIFDTQGASTLATLSVLVANRSKLRHESWKK